MDPAIGVFGWVLGAGATVLGLLAARSRRTCGEAVVRVGHELRGPLTAARLGLELGARTGELSSARLRAIDVELERAALALDDLGAIRGRGEHTAAAGLRRQLAAVDVADLLRDSVEAWRGAAEKGRTRLCLEGVGARVSVWGNRLRLGQATGNLIANAIEHGGEEVRVRCLRTGDVIRVEVSDDGPGLAAPVSELARHARRGRGARGRGLAIALAVATEHGGRLAAAPAQRGARLVLELPALREDAAGGPQEPREVPS